MENTGNLLNNNALSTGEKTVDFAGAWAAMRESLAKGVTDARGLVQVAQDKLGKAGDDAMAELLLSPNPGVLLEALKNLKALVFNGTESVDIGVSGGRLNKVSKRLCVALETQTFLQSLAAEWQRAAEEVAPGYSLATYSQAARAAIVLKQWNGVNNSETEVANPALLIASAVRSLAETGKLSLTFFICPPVDFSALLGQRPEEYFGTDMRGSLLSRQIGRLNKLAAALAAAEVPANINAVIGDTDEDAYIWPVLGKPAALDEMRLDERRLALRDAAQIYCERGLSPAASSRLTSSDFKSLITVTGLSRFAASLRADAVFEDVIGGAEQFFSVDEVAAEKNRMRELWKEGDYYTGLRNPSEVELEKIVVRKFAAYAQQGVLLYERDPNSILIQTERPAQLRTKMLNVGRNLLGLSTLPAV
jgi:hypothetical protein